MSDAKVPGSAITEPLKPPDNVHLDDTGENRLRKLDPVRKDLQALGALYEKWQRCGASKNNTVAAGCWNEQPKYGDGKEEKQGLRKLGACNFGHIYAAYGKIDNMHSAGEGLAATATRGVKDLEGNWSGKAADTASGKVHALGTTAENYQEILQSAGGHTMGLWQAMTKAVDNLATFADGKQAQVLPEYRYLVADTDPDAHPWSEGGIKEGREASNSYIDQINLALTNGLYGDAGSLAAAFDPATGTFSGAFEAVKKVHETGGVLADVVAAPAAALVGATVGQIKGFIEGLTPPEPSSDPGGTPIDGNGLRQPSACQLDGGHGDWWSNEACTFFDEFADAYHAVIRDLRKRITQATKDLDEGLTQFTTGISALGTDPFASLAPPDDGTGGSDSGGSDSGGGDSGGGHSRGKGPGGTSPSSYHGRDPGSSGGTPGLPQTPPPDATHNPSPGGVDIPSSRSPGTDDDGEPGQHRESVTVGHGDEKITMSSEDGSGKLRLTVDDGDGESTTYDVDFGQGGGMPQPQPGTDVPAGQADSGESGIADAGKPVSADENGHAEIHNGDETISVDRPQDGSGELTVSVDDGSGEPTAYTLDMDGSEAGGSEAGGVPDIDGSAAAADGAMASSDAPSGASGAAAAASAR